MFSRVFSKNKKFEYIRTHVPNIPGMPSLENSNPKSNPLTGMFYSSKFDEILEKRLKLPVWEYRKDFFDIIANNQIMVLVGETGSGKTTQVYYNILILNRFLNGVLNK